MGSSLPKGGRLGYCAGMKFFAVTAVFLLAFLLASAQAQQGPDDDYIGIYGMIEQADTLAGSGQPRQALTEYQTALNDLERFQKIYPTWSPNIVTYRLSYLADKIAATSALLPVENAATPPVTLPPVTSPVAAPGANADAGQAAQRAAQLAAQLTDLQAQVQNLQAGNLALTARLKEALSVQPSAADPRELAAAQDKVRSLMKENDLLRVSLIESKTPAEAGVLLVDSNKLARTERDLAAMDKQLTYEVKVASRYTDENQALQAQVKSLQASNEGMLALREENVLLKKQLAEAKAGAKKSKADARLKAALAKAQAKIDALTAAARVYELDKAALQARVKQLEQAASQPPPAPADNMARIRDLEQERDSLRAQLDMAKARPSKKNRSEAAQVDQLNEQVKTLEARLAVDEAQPVPYTEEELALFRQTPPAPADLAGGNYAPALSGDSAELVASARAHFAAGEFDQAAGDFQKVLQHDENNGLVLANLAAIELQQGHLADAEKHILAAVAKSPNDAYNLSILGNLRFQQQKYDEALDVLSRAAKLDPQNPEIENYLGVTLGQKGLRLQAETALRKALVLNPDYAPAHNNLAVVYISETPPRAELARWHYMKALAAGQPHNPGLEKMLSDNGAPIPAP